MRLFEIVDREVVVNGMPFYSSDVMTECGKLAKQIAVNPQDIDSLVHRFSMETIKKLRLEDHSEKLNLAPVTLSEKILEKLKPL